MQTFLVSVVTKITWQWKLCCGKSGLRSVSTLRQLAFLGNWVVKGLWSQVCFLSYHRQNWCEQTQKSRLRSTIARMIPDSTETSFKEEKEAYDICKLTINARGKKWWGVWPRICCTLTQWITFSTSYGSGQKKILGKVTLWMCQKHQLPLAIFNCRNLIRKDGCTQLVFLPLHPLCNSDISECYALLQLTLAAQYVLWTQGELHTSTEHPLGGDPVLASS